jgi:hypothetical protein
MPRVILGIANRPSLSLQLRLLSGATNLFFSHFLDSSTDFLFPTSVVYFTQFVLAVISCFSTKEEREAREQRKEEKRLEREAEEQALREYEEILKSPTYGYPMTPASVYTGVPGPALFTPRTPAFNRVMDSPSSDLPLRNHFSTPHPQRFSGQDGTVSSSSSQQQPYFPPPPTKPTN